MHIVFLTDNFPPESNACASRVFERAKYWVQWGHQVTIITCAPNFPDGKCFAGYKNKWVQTEIMAGIRVVRVKTFMAANRGTLLRIIDFLSYMLMAIIVGIWQKNPDVIIATSPQFFTAVGGWMLSKFKRKPFIFELSDIWPESITAVGAMKPSFALRALEKFELFLYHQAVAVVVLTPAFKSNLSARGIAAEKIHVILNGVETSQFSPREKDIRLMEHYHLTDKFVIGYIGTLGMAHDLTNVIEAAKLCQTNSRLHFLLVGSGAERDKLIALSTQYQLKNVQFIPRQDKQVIIHYWSLCHLALVHLKNDATFRAVIPSKLFEIMGMGLPICCVAPDGEATKIVNATQSGFTIPAGNPEILAKALHALPEQSDQLTTWANNSYQARLQYTREKQARAMLDIAVSCVNVNQSHTSSV